MSSSELNFLALVILSHGHSINFDAFVMSRSSEKPSADAPVPQITDDQQAVEILVNLAARRRSSNVLSKDELLLISDLLQTFIDSATLRTYRPNKITNVGRCERPVAIPR